MSFGLGKRKMALRQSVRYASLAASIAIAGSFGGCGGIDGVELNGKVFDWLGVSSAAMEASKREPKLASRAPLVVPPDVNRLPEPGSGQIAATDDKNWPTDPEERKQAQAKERERLHLAYCRGEIQWKDRVLNKDDSAPRSPFGPCPGLFSGMTGGLNKN
jgi:hypothetical protein